MADARTHIPGSPYSNAEDTLQEISYSAALRGRAPEAGPQAPLAPQHPHNPRHLLPRHIVHGCPHRLRIILKNAGHAAQV